MNIITTTALANLKKNRSRNVLIGIAIALTAFLLTMLPTTVMGQLSLQFKAVNKLYSPIHGVYGTWMKRPRLKCLRMRPLRR